MEPAQSKLFPANTFNTGYCFVLTKAQFRDHPAKVFVVSQLMNFSRLQWHYLLN